MRFSGCDVHRKQEGFAVRQPRRSAQHAGTRNQILVAPSADVDGGKTHFVSLPLCSAGDSIVFPSGDQADAEHETRKFRQGSQQVLVAAIGIGDAKLHGLRPGTSRMKANCLPSGEKVSGLSMSRINWRAVPPRTGIR